jgi:chemotaxis protein CheD
MSSAAPAGGGLLVVGLGALQVCSDPGVTLITYALGSCLGVAVHDPVAQVGGLLHALLPRIDLDEARARSEPAVFVESGLPALFRACYALGARKERLVVRLAGAGTSAESGRDHFEIGRRNLLMARQLFWKNGVLVRGQDVGGSGSRTLSLHVGSGAVLVRSAAGSIHL